MEGLEFQVENFTLNRCANSESLQQEGGHMGCFRASRSRSRSRSRFWVGCLLLGQPCECSKQASLSADSRALWALGWGDRMGR